MASASPPLTAEDIAWLTDYAAEVRSNYGQEFAAAVDRFQDGPILLERFSAAIDGLPVHSMPCIPF